MKMDNKRILKYSTISVTVLILALIIIILSIRNPTYDEVISMSKARLAGTQNISLDYEVVFAYRGSTKVSLSGESRYNKVMNEVNWTYGINDLSGTIYELKPEDLLDLMTDVDDKEFIGVIKTTNKCYEVLGAIDYTEINSPILPKKEDYLIGYEILEFYACLDTKTGYPLKYLISVTNSLNREAAMIIYYTRELR